MQARRLRPDASRRPRWGAHLILLTTMSALTWAALPAPLTGPAPADIRPPVFRGIPAAPDPSWRPVRTPLRSSIVRDPLPPAAVGEPQPPSSLGDEPPVDGPSAVVLETDPGPGPATVLISTREATIWSGVRADASPLEQIPRLAVLEAVGPPRDGRVPVRIGSPGSISDIRAWIDAAAVTVAGPLAARSWERPFAFGERELRLTVPYRTQLDGSAAAGANCGPASLGMILDSFSISASTAELRSRAHTFQGTSGSETGFLLEVLKDVAESYGLEGQGLKAGTSYRRWTLDEIRQHLRAGQPVIPQLRYRLMPGREWAAVNYDHYVVLTGLDGDDFLFNDPIPFGPRREGQGRLSAAQLLRAWSNSDAPMAGLAIAGPR